MKYLVGKTNMKMGVKIYMICVSILVYFYSLTIVYVHASLNITSEGQNGGFMIDGRAPIAKIDDDFICATIDWWPPLKCDYGSCSWDHASLLNLDLSNKILLKAVQAFSPLKIRLGGSLQDMVIYESKDSKQPCNSFTNNTSKLFGFSYGCLPMKRWDALNVFFNKAGALVVFGLNALTGRNIQSDGSATGAWDSSNAKSLISYTAEKGYNILGWELGNELCGDGVGTRVAAAQYASDVITLKNLIEEVYKANKTKPLVIAPGGFFKQDWFSEFVNKTQNNVDVLTHHIYNLGPGSDPNLIKTILNPSSLDTAIDTFSKLHDTIGNSGTSAVAWVGEAGGAYNSGQNHVTNAFVFSFWYLDQLGMASKYNTKTYCRQSLIGGNYGLLNTTTFVPNPDYYSALLWHKLMGRNVLTTRAIGMNKTRVYAHCSKVSQGITMLIINLEGNTTFVANVAFNGQSNLLHLYNHNHHHHQSHKTKPRSTEWHETKTAEPIREEYHLTAKDGNLQSQTMLLNGQPLSLTSTGEIPDLNPMRVKASAPLDIKPLSIVFIHVPYSNLPGCKS